MEASFPWYLFSSFLCVFSRSMLNVSLAKQADVSDNLNIITKICIKPGSGMKLRAY